MKHQRVCKNRKLSATCYIVFVIRNNQTQLEFSLSKHKILNKRRFEKGKATGVLLKNENRE